MLEVRHDSLTHSLREQQHVIIRQLANALESIWQKELVLSDYQAPADLGYVEGMLEGERLTIENCCYQAPQFRKLHLELAKVGNNLDILHCVMFPRPAFHLPIFGLDIVANRERITAAIVDLSPVSADRSLPAQYEEVLAELPVKQFTQPRALPAWGDIFSERCLFVRPVTPQEGEAFLAQAVQYLTVHCQLSARSLPTQSVDEQASILARQRHYCLQQQKNDKTRCILERAFGRDWAEHYLQTMLFDCVAES